MSHSSEVTGWDLNKLDPGAEDLAYLELTAVDQEATIQPAVVNENHQRPDECLQAYLVRRGAFPESAMLGHFDTRGGYCYKCHILPSKNPELQKLLWKKDIPLNRKLTGKK